MVNLSGNGPQRGCYGLTLGALTQRVYSQKGRAGSSPLSVIPLLTCGFTLCTRSGFALRASAGGSDDHGTARRRTDALRSRHHHLPTFVCAYGHHCKMCPRNHALKPTQPRPKAMRPAREVATRNSSRVFSLSVSSLRLLTRARPSVTANAAPQATHAAVYAFMKSPKLSRQESNPRLSALEAERSSS